MGDGGRAADGPCTYCFAILTTERIDLLVLVLRQHLEPIDIQTVVGIHLVVIEFVVRFDLYIIALQAEVLIPRSHLTPVCRFLRALYDSGNSSTIARHEECVTLLLYLRHQAVLNITLSIDEG